MKPFPFKLNSQIVKLLTEIDEFKGTWSGLRGTAPERLAELKTVSVIQSVGSSTRIEGATLSDAEVTRLMGGMGKRSFKSRDEEEVAGYADTLTEVYTSWEHIPLSENHIKQLHGMALKHSSKDQRHRGEYKKAPNHVVAADAKGKVVGIVFKTATPFETPMRMRELVEMTRQELEAKEEHPLLVIGAFIVYFLAIHPFQDGNGRISRILTNLLLLRQGYVYAPYSSLEHIVEANKSAYYLALRSTQITLDGKTPDLSPWLMFFLRTLKSQKDHLNSIMEQASKISSLDKLDSDILKTIEEQGKLGLSDLAAATGANKDTMKLRLSKLVKVGRLERQGKGPATFYQLAARTL